MKPKSSKKSRPAVPVTPALFDVKDLVSDVQLARIPDHADSFTVPLRSVSMRVIQKPRKGNWGDIFAEPLHGLDLQRQTTQVSRAWLLRAERYIDAGVLNKGQMQRDLTQVWPDFRPFWVKVDAEEKAA